MKEQIAECVQQAVDQKVFPGCVVGVVKKTGERTILPFGHLMYEPDAAAVNESMVYDLASVTKSIPTSSLALMLIDEGKLSVQDKLIDYLPEFQNSDREQILIQHLLTYTLDGYGLARAVDGSDGASLDARTSADVLTTLLTHEFEKRPGTVFKYSNIPAALLGLVVEKITGTTLDVLADEYFFSPLGMTRTTFYPELFPVKEIAPTEIDPWRGLVQGVVHDESAYICKRDGKIMGYAGLFSTASDLLTFLEMLLNNGILNGRNYFSQSIIEQIETNQIPQLNDSTGLGWELNQPRYMGPYCSEHTFGKTGFTGTLVVGDRAKEVAYVLLSNRTYPKRTADSAAINAVRAKVGEIILK